jgi:hypothetical protein
MRLYIGLVHYPVYNKNHQRIASAITTVDLHDLARLAKTYYIKRFFVITPLEDQQELAERVRAHWTQGYGATYNVNRKDALELICVAKSLDQANGQIKNIEGNAPILIATDAAERERSSISFEDAERLIQNDKPVMLIFGTAWGLDDVVIDAADYVLYPIHGRSEYNHLSVRSAAAIILDRVAGSRYGC